MFLQFNWKYASCTGPSEITIKRVANNCSKPESFRGSGFRVKACHFKFDRATKFYPRTFVKFVFLPCIDQCFIHAELSIRVVFSGNIERFCGKNDIGAVTYGTDLRINGKESVYLRDEQLHREIRCYRLCRS